MRRLVFVLLFAPLLLTSCGGAPFFSKDGSQTCGFAYNTSTCTPSGGSSGGSTGSGDYAFVANAGSNTVTGLSISSTGTLSALSGSPISLGAQPLALTVSRSNNFLWIGTVSQIFGYSIGSGGALTALNSGAALANAYCVDMQTSPDGKWLMVLDGSGVSIDLFQINSDGTLSAASGIGFNPSGTVVPKQLRVAPGGGFVVAALGTAGEMVFSFNTSTGAFTQLSQTVPPNLTSDNGIAIDSTGTYLYEARSGSGAGLVVNTIASNGALTPTTSVVYGAGTQPYSVTLDSTGKYVYVANRGDGTITGYSIGTNAALAAISGSPFTSGSAVTSLGVDSSGTWLLAAAYSGSPDLSLYGYDSTTAGKLNRVSSVSTGTNASVLALSH